MAICFSSFFIFMTFYILAVTLPSFVLEQLQGNKEGIGLVTTVFIIAAVIFRPLTGRWLEEGNRKKLVVLSLILFTACSVLYLFVSNYALLLALRFVHGISFGMAATATSAIVLDVIPDKRKGEGVGYFSLFMSLAMVVGPFFGLWLTTHLSYYAMFIAVTVFSLLSFVSGMSAQVVTREQSAKTGAASAWDIRRYIEPKAIPIALAGFFLAFSYAAIATFISVYAKSIGLEAIASYFFIVFAAMILISRPFTGRLFDRRGEHILVYPGIILFFVGMIWLSQAQSAMMFLIAGGIIGLGYGAILPSFQTIAIQASSVHRRALATSTYFVLFDTGYGLGSYILGIVAAHTDYHTMYFIGGLIVALSIVLYYLLHHRKQRSRLVLKEGAVYEG